MSEHDLEMHHLRIIFLDKSGAHHDIEVEIRFPEKLKNFSTEFDDICKHHEERGESKHGTRVELPIKYMETIVTKILDTAKDEILKAKTIEEKRNDDNTPKRERKGLSGDYVSGPLGEDSISGPLGRNYDSGPLGKDYDSYKPNK